MMPAFPSPLKNEPGKLSALAEFVQFRGSISVF
jgi:hypothetical protein